MRRGEVFVFLGLLFGVFFVNGVIAQADVCLKETAPLFTASQKIYLNDPLNVAKTNIAESEMSNFLKRGVFSGNVETEYTQNIEIGSDPSVVFAKQPTSSDDPLFLLRLSNVASNYFYKTSITFSRAVDFTDSKEQNIKLFSKEFRVSPETNNEQLVLVTKESQISLSDKNPYDNSIFILGRGLLYITLVSASDVSATIEVGLVEGRSEIKEIREGSSAVIKGVSIKVLNADETNLEIFADLIIGEQKLYLHDNAAIQIGDTQDVVDGTLVNFEGSPSSLDEININIFASDSDHDAVLAQDLSNGRPFVDPIFGTFKIDFLGFNIGEWKDDLRDIIQVLNLANDRIALKMTDHRGNMKTFQWAISKTIDSIDLDADQDGKKIHVLENEKILKDELAVAGESEDGRLVKVRTITNREGTVQDRVEFTDVFSGDIYRAVITADGFGTVNIGGKSYDVHYEGDDFFDDTTSVRIDYPDSQGKGKAIIYPTIASSKGAKVALYKPITISLNNWDGNGNVLTDLMLPDGDRYTDLKEISKLTEGSHRVTVGQLVYNIEKTKNEIKILLENPKINVINKDITNPALIIFEEKDKDGKNNAIIVTLEPGNSGDDGIGVDEVIRTWTIDGEWDAIALPSESTKTKEADVYGTIATIDSIDSDQRIAFINYPDEQVYANIYLSSDICGVPSGFIRGDTDRSNKVELTDAVNILFWLFKGGDEPKCLDAADADDNGKVELTDAIKILNHLFSGDTILPQPYPDSGLDETEDGLDCKG